MEFVASPIHPFVFMSHTLFISYIYFCCLKSIVQLKAHRLTDAIIRIRAMITDPQTNTVD